LVAGGNAPQQGPAQSGTHNNELLKQAAPQRAPAPKAPEPKPQQAPNLMTLTIDIPF